jgi:phytanoyl-CoA hydroxylase
MRLFWDDNGYLIIDDYYTHEECDSLRIRAEELIKNFDPFSHNSIFNTKKQIQVDDKYFLDSGDKIRFFFEEGAFDKDGNFTNSIELLINKIGHALHDLDPIFKKFSHSIDLNNIAKAIGVKEPLLIQSMYIFKQPKIGGEVVCHQDSTFLHTKPESAIGFWVALEDATKENGCMWTSKGGHKGSLRKLFKRQNNILKMETLDKTPFDKMDTPLEVKKGSLILLHGRLPHYSGENKSKKSRHAYTLHIIDGKCDYSFYNWLQRSNNMPLKGFID